MCVLRKICLDERKNSELLATKLHESNTKKEFSHEGHEGKKGTGAEAPAGAEHQRYDLITATSAMIAPMRMVRTSIIISCLHRLKG